MMPARTSRRSAAAALSALALGFSLLAGAAACGPALYGRAAVSMTMERAPSTPRDAAVIIDEEYIGPLHFVAARGVRLPVGEHRITVQKPGYFPWDQLVEADREPIHLKVELVPIPD
jgi:hypothetical protein